jgi:RNA polymerase sigma-70 factor, ECF subfamily
MYGCMDDRGVSDATLLTASVENDGAFRVLYDRYAHQILRYHRRRCGDEETAFDLVAETFAQAWCVRSTFRDEADGSAAPWLYGIARNVLFQSVRRQRLEDSARQRLGALEQSGRSQLTPEESWLDGADELLESLPTEQRRAVELRVVEDTSYDRVARVLEITPENARMRVHRALKTLRKRDSKMAGETR